MNKTIEELKENLPKECCSFCTHLSLEGPSSEYKYNIKCIIFDSLPRSNNRCNYFEPEACDINTSNLDDLYTEFLEACIKSKPDEYLNSIHFKLFKDYVLNNVNECSKCGSTSDLDIYYINKNFGRETLEDVIVLCGNCKSNV